MSRVIAVQSVAGETPLAPPHATGDLLLMAFAGQYAGILGSAPSGWTELHKDTSGLNAHRSASYWKIAASGAETFPDPYSAAGSYPIIVSAVFRGVTGTPIAASNNITDTGLDYTAGAVTTTQDGQLIFLINFAGVVGRHCIPAPGVIETSRESDSQNFIGTSFFYGGASGASEGDHRYHGNSDTAFAQRFLTIALQDDGAGETGGDVDRANPPAEMVHFLGATGDGGEFTGTRQTFDPTSDIATVDNGSYSNTTRYQALSTSLVSPVIGTRQADIQPSSVTTLMSMAATDINASVDLSGAIIATQHIGTSVTPSSDGGKILGIYNDVGTAWARMWQIDAVNLKPNARFAKLLSVIEVDGGFEELDDVGTPDSSDVTSLVLGSENSSNNENSWGPLWKLGTVYLKGGTTGTPVSMVEAAAATSNIGTIQNQGGQSDAHYLCAQSVSVGNGTDAVVFSGAGQSVAFPPAYNAAALKTQIKVSQGALEFTFDGVSGSDVSPAGMAFDMGDYHKWGPAVGCLGTFDTTGALVRSCTPVLEDTGSAWAGLLIAASKKATYTTLADLSGGGVILDGCVDEVQLEVSSQADLSKIANTTWRNHNRCLEISGNQTGTLNFPGSVDMTTNNTVAVRYSGATDFILSVPASTTGVTALTVENTGAGTMTVQAASTITMRGTVASTTRYRLTNADDADALIEEGTHDASPDVVNTTAIISGETADAVFARGDGTYSRGTTSGEVADSALSLTVIIPVDAGRSVNDTTALAYTGIAYDGTDITVTANHTWQEVYDWVKAYCNEVTNLDLDDPVSSVDGVNYVLASGKGLICDGADVETTTQALTGGTGASVTNGGFFEDSTGAKWDDGGTLTLLRHEWLQVVDLASSTGQQYAVYAVFGTEAAQILTYTTGLVRGAVESDASGNIECYVAYKVGATTQTLTAYTGLYGFAWLAIPAASTGAQVGSASSRNVLRLSADTNVTLSRTAALAISGVVVTHSTKRFDYGGNTYSQAQDNAKARQARAADIESGKPGVLSYIEVGNVLAFNGSAYVQPSDWTAVDAPGGAVLSGGIVELDTPGTVGLDVNAVEFEYTVAGTYDHRGDTLTGSIDFDAAVAVTAQILPSVTQGTVDPNVTIEATVAMPVTYADLPDNTYVTVYNDTQATVLGRYTTSGGTGLSANFTLGSGEEVVAGDVISLRGIVAAASATTHYQKIEGSGIASSGGIAFAGVPALWPEMNDIGTVVGEEGSTISEFTLDAGNLDIDVSDGDGTTLKRRIPLRWYYFLGTATGMDSLWTAFTIFSANQIRQNVTEVDVVLHNVGTGPVQFTDNDCRLYRSDFDMPYDPTGQSIFMDYEGVPLIIETGVSGLTASESATLTATASSVAALPTETLEADERAHLLALANGLTVAQEAKLDAIPTETLTTAQNDQLMALVNGLDAGDLTYLAGEFGALPTASELVAAIFAHVLEGTLPFDEALRIILSGPGGDVTGAGTTTVRLKSQDGAKDRVVATVDALGNRTVTARDGS